MLLLPLQRVLEYPALLNAICLYFPRGHPELAILDQTRLLFLQNTAVLEENKQNAEAYIKTIELKSKISSLPQGFVVPKRRYICDDTLSLVTPDKKLAERRFFLFSDIIVETRPSSSSSKPFRMLSSMLLNDARTEDVPDGTYTNAFTLENQSFCKIKHKTATIKTRTLSTSLHIDVITIIILLWFVYFVCRLLYSVSKSRCKVRVAAAAQRDDREPQSKRGLL